MEKEILPYLESLKDEVKRIISSDLNSKESENLIQNSFADYYANDRSSAFNVYYFETVANTDLFLHETGFFRRFKQQYSLQGVDGEYLNTLEGRKNEILDLIESGELATLYSKYFARARLKYKDTTKVKSLGSFFAKLVHTFAPDKYCALDNPIKNYLGLEKESFYCSLFVISAAYRDWATENHSTMNKIRLEAMKYSKREMTDLKLLDLIFWYIANRKRLH